ncbi:TPA: hypothetical protein ACOB2D_001952, partial [Neisseria gonorrhoeae]
RQLRFAAVVSGRLKNKKQPAQPVFLAANLNPNSRPVLSPRGRELARGQQAARLVLGRLSCWERLPQLGECPLPSPPPRGREWVSADFSVAGGLKNNLNLQPLISGRLKKDARNINSGNFSGSLYCQADGTNAASVFSDNL